MAAPATPRQNRLKTDIATAAACTNRRTNQLLISAELVHAYACVQSAERRQNVGRKAAFLLKSVLWYIGVTHTESTPMPRTPRAITFTCSWCYKDVTENRMPGPTPQYCQACAGDVKRSATAKRVERYRQRQAELDVTPWWHKTRRGRPRKV
jgi:hypothetical protein